MSDLKISELAAVATLLGTEEFALAKSGATKKITGSDLATSLKSLAGGLSQQYIGYNTAGASSEDMNAGRAYCKQVTLSSAGFLASIGGRLKGNGSNVGAIGTAVYTDSSGSPANIIAFTPEVVTSILLNTTARWIDLPIGVWLPAGTYWITLWASNVTAASMSLAYDGSGSDKYTDSDNPWVSDSSVAISTGTTVNKYSIRGCLLS